ncbi:hypothetical protein [Burkholderia pyrrocinia]|uniref:hypothetical protein n=1 Tax=Burkholderia pyrrocinia TaxID=60550 RepID=UPI002AB2CF88|nr:hypothetical protein [Burkholderia pyrrocinia]
MLKVVIAVSGLVIGASSMRPCSRTNPPVNVRFPADSREIRMLRAALTYRRNCSDDRSGSFCIHSRRFLVLASVTLDITGFRMIERFRPMPPWHGD